MTGRKGWAKGIKQSKEHIQKRREAFTPELRKKAAIKNRETVENKYKNIAFEDLSIEHKKRRILEFQENKCNVCGNDRWLGKKITLELEHKDGNCSNDSRENLECLCPNCHSLTPTWKVGHLKHKTGRQPVVNDENLLYALKNNKTIRKALKNVGLTAKGGNYNRCYELLAKNLSRYPNQVEDVVSKTS